ncbi:dihydrolipoyllysine-residue succinyltransferase [Roseibacillus persicicus]|uniref:Dihydrolipoyllysine-residue succinyltransferase n=1 Tax=Roseibacillus persicicus TaxID=454148 RepID=A0A918TPY7_9BACT|nr:dihydrolipoyllysine-residue succinyltransferase [Roseibacillus persicicus]GHC51674.1 dihydrolipoyllysine-residue succinyltransferase component of 2-oxoglutarate dehydrogenase complex [Roseibacillus persicicus]
MAEEVKIPPFGESITTANVSRWHVSDGDFVKKGDTLVSLETDKVSQDLDADADGVIKILVEEDEEVEVGAVIAEIDTTANASGSSSSGAEAAPSEAGGEAGSAEAGSGEVHDIKIPPFGESIATASLAAWKVQSGDFVEKGDTLISLESDKVSQDLEADYSGLIEILVEEGEEVEIGTVIARLTEGAGGSSASAPSQPAKTEAQPAEAAPEKAKTALASAAAETARIKPSLSTSAPPSNSSPASSAGVQEGRSTRKKMSMLRRKIAQHLVNAQQTAAILSTFNEVDMSAIMKLRKEVQEEFVSKHGVKLGFMSLFTKAVVHALKETPGIRSFIDGNEIIENDFYDIGVAVGTDKGLVVPVIRDCDQKSFADIEKAIAEAAGKAKDGTMQIEDLQGGVFTISNGGVYGSLLSTPILNPPQSGILGMHTIQQRPVAVDGKVEIRPMMYLALSYDHRIVDGKEAVTFLISIKNSLENPARLLLEC